MILFHGTALINPTLTHKKKGSSPAAEAFFW
jgi:hypothetical protein